MQKKTDSKLVRELRSYIKNKKAIIATNTTLKNLKRGKLEKIFISSNCPEKTEKDLLYYARLSGVKVVKLKHPNDELGIICKKPFSISVLGLLKE
jgi:large subunit ribosomal protein L30e